MLSNKLAKTVVGAALAALTMLTACDKGTDDAAPETSAPATGESATVSAEQDESRTPQRAVVSDLLPYGEVSDELVYGYFVFPSDMIEPLPAIVIVHERWGLNDDVRERADELAADGYIVLAVDLFNGKTTANPAEARELVTAIVEDPEPARANIASAHAFVNDTAGAPRTGMLGWGFGGTWALNSAIHFGDDLDAVVVYYGQVTADEDKLQPVEAPLLGLFGGSDRGVSAESVESFRQALQRLRKNYDVHVYPNARGGFANPSSNAYDAASADDAWSRTLDFLRLHLSVESTS